MKVLHSWLAEYIVGLDDHPVGSDPVALGDVMSDIGLCCEEVERDIRRRCFGKLGQHVFERHSSVDPLCALEARHHESDDGFGNRSEIKRRLDGRWVRAWFTKECPCGASAEAELPVGLT